MAVASPSPITEITLRAHSDKVLILEFSADEQYLASSAVSDQNQSERTVKIWNTSTQSLYRELPVRVPYSQTFLKYFAFSPHGNYFVTSSFEGMNQRFLIWNLGTQSILQEIRNVAISQFDWSPDEKYLMTIWWNESNLWNDENYNPYSIAGFFVEFDPEATQTQQVTWGRIKSLFRWKWVFQVIPAPHCGAGEPLFEKMVKSHLIISLLPVGTCYSYSISSSRSKRIAHSWHSKYMKVTPDSKEIAWSSSSISVTLTLSDSPSIRQRLFSPSPRLHK